MAKENRPSLRVFQNNILNYALYNQQFGASLDAIGALNAIRSNQAHGPNQPGQLGTDMTSGLSGWTVTEDRSFTNELSSMIAYQQKAKFRTN